MDHSFLYYMGMMLAARLLTKGTHRLILMNEGEKENKDKALSLLYSTLSFIGAFAIAAYFGIEPLKTLTIAFVFGRFIIFVVNKVLIFTGNEDLIMPID